MRFDIKLLGTFEAAINGVSIVPSAAKPRQLLAILALNVGHPLPVSTLISEIWGHGQPRTAVTTLHTYIGKLRKGLELAVRGDADRVKEVLATERIGYRLNMPSADVDTGRYEQSARAGRRAAEKGDYLTASQRLGDALAMWRGSALSDVPAGPHLTVEIVRLEETRLSDLDLRIESDLRLGQNRQLLGELAALCARFPMSENFYAKYILALYRSGQQWRALDAYQRLRTTMVEELGVDPSVGMRRLHQAVLRGDPLVEDHSFYTADWPAAAAAVG
jgi:SARP family transcriptional regulator, regulator of embCAB operon